MSWGFAIQTLVLFVDFLIVYVFYKHFLGQKKCTIVHYLIAVIGCMVLVSVVNQHGTDLLRVINAILCVFLLTFLFDGNLKIKLFSVFLVSVFGISADALALFVVEWITDVDLRSLTDGHIYSYASAFTSKLILFLIVKIVCNIRNKGNTRLPTLYWVALAAIPLISGSIIFGFFVASREAANEGSALFFFIAMGLIFINGVVFVLFESMLEKNALQARERQQQQQNDALIEQYNAVIKEQQETNSLRHDMKSNIEVTYNLIKTGEPYEALKYMDKLYNLTVADKIFIKTGNAVVDAVFNSAIKLAKEKDIRIENEGFIVPRIMDSIISANDMCVIFANSLSNAIEACERITDGEKYIRFGLVQEEDSIIYRISNPTNGELVEKDGYYKTSKKHSDVHGLGLSNIDKTLKKYNATLTLHHTDNIFELGFILPFKEI